MQYCINHNKKAYTEEEFEEIETCEHSGVYQGTDSKIRVYCFKALDEAICPKEKEIK